MQSNGHGLATQERRRWDVGHWPLAIALKPSGSKRDPKKGKILRVWFQLRFRVGLGPSTRFDTIDNRSGGKTTQLSRVMGVGDDLNPRNEQSPISR